jgi:uncharacterized protein
MEYYVYVYIDPRNHEEFYYGKGKGSRKDVHLESETDTEKAKRIAAIRKAGLEPIIRVVASGLTENEALLVEKTLLHKLGKSLTNISSGHYADKFRPHDTLHVELPGFDFRTGVYYFNVGQGKHRKWADCRKYRFISAGQGAQWVRAICGFNIGDIFAAYLKGKGFVGIGEITEKAGPIREVKIDGRPLVSLPLECKKMDNNIDSNEKCEHVALVRWIKSVPEGEAKFRSGIYTTPLVRASLDNQPKTRFYLEEAFGVNFSKLTR